MKKVGYDSRSKTHMNEPRLNHYSARLTLINLVNKAVEDFLHDNRFLNRVEENNLMSDEWHTFAVQRYLSARPFDQLLEAGTRSAYHTGAVELESVIQRNVRDEQGIDEQGAVDETRAHATWRKEYYSAIGVSDQDLATAMHPAAKQYADVLKALIHEADALKLAGVILALEAIIPREFAKIKVGRDKKFPHLSEKARLYIDDHIIHDAQSHYPDLLAALAPLIVDEAAMARVEDGINKITAAKKQFYALLPCSSCDAK